MGDTHTSRQQQASSSNTKDTGVDTNGRYFTRLSVKQLAYNGVMDALEVRFLYLPLGFVRMFSLDKKLPFYSNDEVLVLRGSC